MEWIEEQLKLDKQWSTTFPHVLSPLAESGIRFLMYACPFSEDWDKMKTLIVVNKFLNGLVAGQMIRRGQQWLICNPVPQSLNMPNLDYGEVPEGTQPERPSAVLDQKENLREIFRELYNHVFRMRLADNIAQGNNSWTESLSASHEWVAKWNPGGRKMRTPLGCYVHRPAQRMFSHVIGGGIQEFCTLNIHIRSRENPDIVVPIAQLTNAQMGQNQGSIFDQSHQHPFWDWSRRPPRRRPGEPSTTTNPTHSIPPQSRMRGSSKSPEPPGDQIAMLHHMDWQATGKLTSYDDGRYRFPEQPAQLPLIKHYAQLLLHVHGIGTVGSKSLYEDGTDIMAQQLCLAPNFGFGLQFAREPFRAHGYIFHLDEHVYAQRRLANHQLNISQPLNLRQGQTQWEYRSFIPCLALTSRPYEIVQGLVLAGFAFIPPQHYNLPLNQQASSNGDPTSSRAFVLQWSRSLALEQILAGNGFTELQRPNQAMNQQPLVNATPNGAQAPFLQQPASRSCDMMRGWHEDFSFELSPPNFNQAINPQDVQASSSQQPAGQPLNMIQGGGQAGNAPNQPINHHQPTNVIPNGAQVSVRQQPVNQPLVNGNPSGTRIPMNQQPARQSLNMTQTGGQGRNASSQAINRQPAINPTPSIAGAPVHGQNAGQRPNMLQGLQAGNAFVQDPNLNQTTDQQPPAGDFPGGSQASGYLQSNGKRLKVAHGGQQSSSSIQASNSNSQFSANRFHSSPQTPAPGLSGGQPQNVTQGSSRQPTASFVPAREADEQLLPQGQERLSVPGQQAPTQTNLTGQGNTQIKQENQDNTQVKQEPPGDTKTEQEE
ncbi:hypothetical protein ACHAPJ_003128 [Fusarium lateritium]